MSDVITVCRDISALTAPAQTACNLFLSKCKAKGLKVLITETYRSQERQNYLYEQGRTRAGQVVTWTKNSRHTSRRAWDICKNVKGQEYSDSGFFKACGEVAKGLGITWGGTWTTPDTPHFEISTSWKVPVESEDDEMTKEERQKFNAMVEILEKLTLRVNALENPMIYDYIDKNMPSYAKPTIQKLVGRGSLVGNENGELGLSEDLMRMLAILDREGIFR